MTFKAEHGLEMKVGTTGEHSLAKTSPLSGIDYVESRFEALFQNVRDAIVIADDEGRLVFVNRPACELVGTDAINLSSRHIGEVLAFQEDWGSVRSKVKREGKYRGHGWIRRHNGTRSVVEIQVSADVADGNHLAVLREISIPPLRNPNPY